MSQHPASGRARTKRSTALLAVVAALMSALAITFGNAALADTSGSPDTNTRASFAPAAASQTPLSTLGGAAEGSVVNVHVDGVAGKFFGVNIARLCRSGLTITTSSQLSPSAFGNCIAHPFVSGSDDDAVGPVSAAPTNTSVDFTFRVGTGTQTFNDSSGNPHTITCDAANPCALWLWESVDPSIQASGNIFKHYEITYATSPAAPGLTVTPGNGQLTVDLAAPVNTGNAPLGNYSVTVTGPGAGTQSGAGTHYVFTGLTNFASYNVSATVENNAAGGGTPAHFTSAAATGSATPVPPAPGAPSGVPGNGKVTLSWAAPSGPAPDSYNVVATPTNPAGADITHTGVTTNTNYVFTPLTNGTVYTFKVQGVYSGTPGAFSASSPPIAPNAQLVTQTINVRRPNGALVLTQVCGAHGATTTGSAPTYNGGPDPVFPQYPYPADGAGEPTANYPTDCGVNLGTAKLITGGAGAGQFFEATGFLNQVTVVDTRDTDPGFTVNGQMGTFTSGANSFSGSELGWTPLKTSDTAAFQDSDGHSYDQTVGAGPVVAPNSPAASGLGAGGVLGSAAAGQGLGIAILDANLRLWIPIFAHTGDYVGILSITAV